LTKLDVVLNNATYRLYACASEIRQTLMLSIIFHDRSTYRHEYMENLVSLHNTEEMRFLAWQYLCLESVHSTVKRRVILI